MLAVYILLHVSVCVALDDPIVYTKEIGFIEGFHHKTDSGFDTICFLGIPYAQPPVGHLRFEKPLPFAHQPTTRIKAKSFGNRCCPSINFQKVPKVSELINIMHSKCSEDCLTVNIVTPYNKDENGYPVLVFIHGGAFELGSATEYGYKHMAEHLVSKGIIFVSIQYRLGFLGFLSTGDDRLPGNLGLWDQTRALQFNYDNIEGFGGDRNRITVMGSSAGAMSVSALTVSPHSNGLFNQMIALSGSALSRLAVSDRVVDISKELIEKIGCENEEIEQAVACLKNKTIDELYSAISELPHHSLYFIKFHPRVENGFFPLWYHEALRKSPPKSTLIGASENEGILFLFMRELKFMFDLPVEESKVDTFSEDDFIETLEKYFASEYDYGEKTDELRKLLKEFYLRIEPGQIKNNTFYLERLADAYSDIIFSMPSYLEAEIKMRYGWPIYFYQQEYASAEQQIYPVKGSTHGNDVPYLFDIDMVQPPKEFTEDDARFKRIWLDIIKNFVKHGNPSTKEFQWDPLSEVHVARYLSLTTQPQMKPFFREENVRFWTERVPKDILNEVMSYDTKEKVVPNERTEL